MQGVIIEDVQTHKQQQINTQGIFVSIGRIPATSILQGIDLDAQGYIIASEDTQTNIPGVYAVGDIRTKPLRQVVGAVSDGAIAIHQAQIYLEQ